MKKEFKVGDNVILYSAEFYRDEILRRFLNKEVVIYKIESYRGYDFCIKHGFDNIYFKYSHIKH